MAKKKTQTSKSKAGWKERRPIPVCDLGVLHAFGPGFLHAPNRMLEFKGSGDRRLRVPLRGLKLICLYGAVRVTAGAIKLVTDSGAGLAYFSANGHRSNGTLQPASDAWRGRRYRQFQAAKDRAWMLSEARLLIEHKIAAMEAAAWQFQKHGKLDQEQKRIAKDFSAMKTRAESAPDHEGLRGIEGFASRRWFELLATLLPDGWTFPGRRKRPPTDPINALLSLGYTMLFHRVEAACQAWGLDPAIGIYHEYRPGRSSLACDLMEPFRIPVIDRTALLCLSQSRLSPGDFQQDEQTLAVQMTEDAWKQWLSAIETQMHAPSEGGPTFQTQILDRVRQFAESLPNWDGNWPSAPEPITIKSE